MGFLVKRGDVSQQKRSDFEVIGRGVYTLADTQRLTGVPRDTVRRWTRGYTYRYRGKERHSPPIIATRTPRLAGVPTLDFADLLEVRFLEAFRAYGVSARTIRRAAIQARELLGRPRPFSTRIFKTDGRTILAELVRDSADPMLLDLVRDQYEFKKLVDPHLYDGLEFNQLEEPERWWPLGPERSVVIDPLRAFGAPIVEREGVQTLILASGVVAEGSIEAVAAWYRVEVTAVEDALEFEQSLAA